MSNEAFRPPADGEDLYEYLLGQLKNTIRNVYGGSEIRVTQEGGEVVVNLDEMFVQNLVGRRFLARITGIPNLIEHSRNLSGSDWRFNYTFVTVDLVAKNLGDPIFQIVSSHDIPVESGGTEGVAFNLVELTHEKRPFQSDQQLIYGVNVAQPSFNSGFTPVPSGAIYLDGIKGIRFYTRRPVVVEMHEYAAASGDIIYWFYRMGSYDGVCL